jgi:ribosome-binding protein aMBF1 (putative translation factor)
MDWEDFHELETQVTVECDVCGVAFSGPGLELSVKRVGRLNVCNRCMGWYRLGDGLGKESSQRVKRSRSSRSCASVDTCHTRAVGKGRCVA